MAAAATTAGSQRRRGVCSDAPAFREKSPIDGILII
jgi:hypothetical protein